MAWKLRKDKLQTDAAKEETGDAGAGDAVSARAR